MNKLLVVLSLLLSSLSQCQNPSLQLPTASVADNFIGGRPEYYNVFMTKIEYPEQLYKDKITGTVYFEIEIDTSGQIVNFRIQKGVSPLMNQEVEKKIYLTNGKWKPQIKNGQKVNYRVTEKVYFELR